MQNQWNTRKNISRSRPGPSLPLPQIHPDSPGEAGSEEAIRRHIELVMHAGGRVGGSSDKRAMTSPPSAKENGDCLRGSVSSHAGPCKTHSCALWFGKYCPCYPEPAVIVSVDGESVKLCSHHAGAFLGIMQCAEQHTTTWGLATSQHTAMDPAAQLPC